jgi:hypothetical protein
MSQPANISELLSLALRGGTLFGLALGSTS